jgi:hypothetical protein
VAAKKLPIGISNFETIITEDYIYVDKTKHIYDIITQGRLYFLSRPHGFGKSLLISTLKHIFAGNKKLFHSLWIGKQSDYTWPKYPVIHLDFSTLEHETAESLEISLVNYLNTIAKSYGFELENTLLEDRMRELVKKLAKRGEVVLLIDEYDYPVLQHLAEPQTAKAIRDILSSFFTVIKGLQGKYMHFIFMTGVIQYSITDIFSGMNNLNNISLEPKAATLLGYTQDEIEHYFAPTLALFAKKRNKDKSTILKEMEAWYNGYRFSDALSIPKVYNPLSILYCLDIQRFSNYWFASTISTFLIELIKKYDYTPKKYLHLTDIMVRDNSLLGAFDVSEALPLYTLLFQTGYLTIKSFDEILNAYTLTYPNEEVHISITHLLNTITSKDKQHSDTTALAMRQVLEEHDLDTACSR